MTVQDISNIVNYVGNGAQTSFSFNFRVDSPAWVIIDFTTNLSGINLNNDQDASPGGTVDYSVAPPNNQGIQINRQTPVTQDTDYTRYDPFDSETNEDNLDKLTMIIQDLRALLDGLTSTVLANFKWEFITVAGSRDLVFTDRFKMLQMVDVGGTQTLTVPPTAEVPWEIGDQITFEQKGTAAVSFVGGAGVTINTPFTLLIAAQFGTVTLIMDEVNNWFLAGFIKQ